MKLYFFNYMRNKNKNKNKKEKVRVINRKWYNMKININTLCLLKNSNASFVL